MKNNQSAALNDIQEMCGNSLPPSGEIQGLLDVLEILQDNDTRIAVEFECGESCKTVSNAVFITTIGGLLLLAGDLRLRECCGGKVIKTEIDFIFIPVERIASVEVYEVSCYDPGVLGDTE